ncbi:MAG: hypothetical protein JSW34_01185 [Candidatus Zixiibacteriota bacterium]|nr:MAG: hypothetical protein JSW34_01185 [candidate division Zixibacteria bacterium]
MGLRFRKKNSQNYAAAAMIGDVDLPTEARVERPGGYGSHFLAVAEPAASLYIGLEQPNPNCRNIGTNL